MQTSPIHTQKQSSKKRQMLEMTFGEEEPAISQKEELSMKKCSDFSAPEKTLTEKIAELSLDKPEIPSFVQEF